MGKDTNRLAPSPSHYVDQAATVKFRYNAQSIIGCEGDTIASALFAAGERIFSRSFKYHRPRGLLCCSGECPNCIMEVDGRPNVRACRTRINEGMEVVSQHAWPSVRHDILRLIELFDFFLPIGFYYKTLYKPRFVWKIAEPIIRRLAGLGRVRRGKYAHQKYTHTYESVDVLVIGGGPAGIQAAMDTVANGMSVMLADNERELGGHLRYETRLHPYEAGKRPGYEVARTMESALRAQGNVHIITEATALGSYEGNLVPIIKGNTLIHVRSKAMIVATGCHQYPAVFENNDLPGVMLSRSALRMINLFALQPGRRAVVFTANDEGYLSALECLHAGIEIVAVVDARPSWLQPPQAGFLRSKGVPLFSSATIDQAVGSRKVSAASIIVTENSKCEKVTVSCDLILLATGWQANAALLLQSGCQLELDKKIGQQVPRNTPSGIFAAGELLGLRNLPEILHSAQRAVTGAIQHIRGVNPVWEKELAELIGLARSQCSTNEIVKAKGQKKNFVCFCEDVVEKDLRQGVEEGFDEIETLKRYSTVSMGPCQGRMCSRNSTEICGLASNKDFGAIGTTTSRPPIQPVPLGVLAGPELHPVKRTSMHNKHIAATDQIMNMGLWKRPFIYSSVDEEYAAVRNHAGLIDISTLGKLVLTGTDVPALLDKVYTHRLSDLRPGRSRYGVICDESGIIVDDGTVARLDADHYYVTTSTGNIDLVEQWMKWCVTGTGWCAHILNVTSGIAAINLAGPKSREILSQVTDLDISQSAFSYMSCRQGKVAGVQSILLRVGFVGELGWEIHFPAEYGEYMWESLLMAGANNGIRPFGVDTQRLLRLEKKHVIVGQDTDALSTPYDCGMGWVVKLDKPDFIGRHSLERIRHQPCQNRLVGFQAIAGGTPADGSAIVIDGKLAGRITSVRFSPQLNRYIGLAWVPDEHSKPGASLSFHAGGNFYPAVVVEGAFYDKEGARLR